MDRRRQRRLVPARHPSDVNHLRFHHSLRCHDDQSRSEGRQRPDLAFLICLSGIYMTSKTMLRKPASTSDTMPPARMHCQDHPACLDRLLTTAVIYRHLPRNSFLDLRRTREADPPIPIGHRFLSIPVDFLPSSSLPVLRQRRRRIVRSTVQVNSSALLHIHANLHTRQDCLNHPTAHTPIQPSPRTWLSLHSGVVQQRLRQGMACRAHRSESRQLN